MSAFNTLLARLQQIEDDNKKLKTQLSSAQTKTVETIRKVPDIPPCSECQKRVQVVFSQEPLATPPQYAIPLSFSSNKAANKRYGVAVCNSCAIKIFESLHYYFRQAIEGKPDFNPMTFMTLSNIPSRFFARAFNASTFITGLKVQDVLIFELTGDRKLALRLTLSDKDYVSASSFVVRQHFVFEEDKWVFPDDSIVIGYNPAFTVFCNEKRNEFFNKVFADSLTTFNFEDAIDPIYQFLTMKLDSWIGFSVPASPKSIRPPSNTIGWGDLL